MSAQVIKFPETRHHRWERWRRLQVGLINGVQPEDWRDRMFHDAYTETQEFKEMHALAISKGQTDHIYYPNNEGENL